MSLNLGKFERRSWDLENFSLVTNERMVFNLISLALTITEFFDASIPVQASWHKVFEERVEELAAMVRFEELGQSIVFDGAVVSVDHTHVRSDAEAIRAAGEFLFIVPAAVVFMFCGTSAVQDVPIQTNRCEKNKRKSDRFTGRCSLSDKVHRECGHNQRPTTSTVINVTFLSRQTQSGVMEITLSPISQLAVNGNEYFRS